MASDITAPGFPQFIAAIPVVRCKKGTIKITVEKTVGPWPHPGKDPTTQEVIIERPLQHDGTVCFDGRWVKPELRDDGRYYLRINLPTPTTTAQREINRRCTHQLLTMAAIAVIAGNGFE